MLLKDRTMQRFGRLVVLASFRRGVTWAQCRCDCGAIIDVRSSHLVAGRIKSCGCQRREVARVRHVTHGEASNYRDGMPGSAEYRAWLSMNSRCSLVHATEQSRRNYVDRGITVCEDWQDSFAKFLAAVGRRPSTTHSLDRINNDGNYEPGNVRWATRKEQANNTRRSKMCDSLGCQNVP